MQGTLEKTAEGARLVASENRLADWKNWGPYVSERAWGTLREHYSRTGSAWSSFPFTDAHRRVFRWNEDGIAGFCNRLQNLCHTVAFWNGRDEILKERFFGLGGPEGNHGEDLKDYYFYLDGVPSHSYMKMLYKYPQVQFPYEVVRQQNLLRSREDLEFELVDALRESFEQGEYFDITIEIAKADQEDILYRITAKNNFSEPRPLWIIPQLIFRNRWSWGYPVERPSLALKDGSDYSLVEVEDKHLGKWFWNCQSVDGEVEYIFTDNESTADFPTSKNATGFYKDAFNRYLVQGDKDALNPAKVGTKCAGAIHTVVHPKGTSVAYCRLSKNKRRLVPDDAEDIFATRIQEADEYYNHLQSPALSREEAKIQRQAYAGLLWSKQFYHYSVKLWHEGDPDGHMPGVFPRKSHNSNWDHLYNMDVISMPDKWEYPWYAAWDLAFHMLPMAHLDPEWSRRQIILMLREWFMHPNGQLPAYEWSFGDVNPPVHAWAAFRVYQILKEKHNIEDVAFLERVFHKLLQNFTWWVNRKDRDGNNVFEGGFLGLDNIGVFDRSKPLPTGGYIEQADGTAWMAMYCLNMLSISLELASHRRSYEDIATKFFEHFVYISAAINGEHGLWDEQDGFYYDILHSEGAGRTPMRIQSLVGLIPIVAALTIENSTLENLDRFKRRMDWFLKFRPRLIEKTCIKRSSHDDSLLLSLVSKPKLERILERVLDPDQFLSDFGIRSLSKYHEQRPYVFRIGDEEHRVGYQPAESRDYLFGGNSNWRGPIWFPANYLLIEALHTYGSFYGKDLTISLESEKLSLDKVAENVSGRLKSIFLADADGNKPVFGGAEIFQKHWKENILFYEYFHGDNGAGIGANHQTGWTALIANLFDNDGRLA